MQVFDLLQVENGTAYTEAVARSLYDFDIPQLQAIMNNLGWTLPATAGTEADYHNAIADRLKTAYWRDPTGPQQLDAQKVFARLQLKRKTVGGTFNETHIIQELRQVCPQNTHEVLAQLDLNSLTGVQDEFLTQVG